MTNLTINTTVNFSTTEDARRVATALEVVLGDKFVPGSIHLTEFPSMKDVPTHVPTFDKSKVVHGVQGGLGLANFIIKHVTESTSTDVSSDFWNEFLDEIKSTGQLDKLSLVSLVGEILGEEPSSTRVMDIVVDAYSAFYRDEAARELSVLSRASKR